MKTWLRAIWRRIRQTDRIELLEKTITELRLSINQKERNPLIDKLNTLLSTDYNEVTHADICSHFESIKTKPMSRSWLSMALRGRVYMSDQQIQKIIDELPRTVKTNTLSTRIKCVRKKLGLTQKQFAELLGLGSQVAISHWEKGQTEPNIATIRSICKLGHVSEQWLLSGRN